MWSELAPETLRNLAFTAGLVGFVLVWLRLHPLRYLARFLRARRG